MEKKEIEVKQLQQVIDWMQKDGYDRKATQEIAPIIVKYINQQPSWIACSEMLPEKDGCYLVYYPDTNEYYVEFFNLHIKQFIKGYVQFWMPLPTPPAGQ